MDRCLEEAEKIGVWNIRFNVRTFNAAAIALYERLGFERVGLLKSVACIDGKYVDEYIYQRVVKPGSSTI
jgi:RimJ/RimL family protein N-acetyltransferase